MDAQIEDFIDYKDECAIFVGFGLKLPNPIP